MIVVKKNNLEGKDNDWDEEHRLGVVLPKMTVPSLRVCFHYVQNCYDRGLTLRLLIA